MHHVADHRGQYQDAPVVVAPLQEVGDLQTGLRRQVRQVEGVDHRRALSLGHRTGGGAELAEVTSTVLAPSLVVGHTQPARPATAPTTGHCAPPTTEDRVAGVHPDDLATELCSDGGEEGRQVSPVLDRPDERAHCGLSQAPARTSSVRRSSASRWT
jgi:hypothetical protein